MAKKYTRRMSGAERKKMEEKARFKKIADREARQKDWYEKNKAKFWIILAAVAVVIALAVVAIDYFDRPEGSMRMFSGKLLDAQENAIIKNLGTEKKPRYYTFGTLGDLNGYTLDPDYRLSTNGPSDRNQTFYYKANNADAVIQSVYYSGVADTGLNMIEKLKGYFKGEQGAVQMNGYDINYIYYTYNDTDANGQETNECYASLVMYIDSIRSGSVLINMNTGKGLPETMPTMETMLAESELFVNAVSVVTE